MELPTVNIYQYEQSVTISLLETNIGTTSVDSNTLQLVSQANESLTHGWLDDPKNEINPNFNFSAAPTLANPPVTTPPTVPNPLYLNPVYNALYVTVLYPMGSSNPYPPAIPSTDSIIPYSGTPTTGNGSAFANFGTFFHNALTNPKHQDDLSDALILQVTSILSNPLVWPQSSDTDKTDATIASGYLTDITSLKSTIDALANQEEQTGKTDSNMEQSMLSIDGNAPSNYTSVFTSQMEGLDVVSNILQQGV